MTPTNPQDSRGTTGRHGPEGAEGQPGQRTQQAASTTSADDGLDNLKWSDPDAKQEARKAGLRREDFRAIGDRSLTRDDVRRLAQQQSGSER